MKFWKGGGGECTNEEVGKFEVRRGLGLQLEHLSTEGLRRLGCARIGSAVAVLHTQSGGDRRLLWAKAYSSHLAAAGSSVHQLVGREIIFRYLGTLPPLYEILAVEGVQAVALHIVLENIFRHALDIQIGMVML